MSLKAIETLFHGHRTRSRLEARWMVLFDGLGVAFDYEGQGYVLSDKSLYLPDFYLPTLGLYVEIKPALTVSEPSLARMRNFNAETKATALARLSGKPVMVVYGDPVDYFGVLFRCGTCPIETATFLHANFARCHACGDVLVVAGTRHDAQVRIEGAKCPVCLVKEDSVMAEALKARQARFEHGEQP